MRERRWVRNVLRVVLGLLVVALVYFGITFVQVYDASQRDTQAEAQAIIVLGAAQYDGRPSPVLQQRLDHALALWNDGVAPLIVVTGGKQVGDNHTEAEAGYVYLRNQGVPDARILREERGTNTWEQIAASSRFLRRQDPAVTSVVLVTDGYHAYRVQAVAEDLGFEASVSPSHEGGSARQLARETLAVAVGRIIGYDRLVDLNPRRSG